MPETMAARIQTLRTLPLPDLRDRYREAFDGKEPPSNNRDHLWRRIAWRIQERELGGLSPDAQQRLGDVQASLDPPCPAPSLADGQKDRRLPAPGTLLRRPYKDRTIEVKILNGAFEFQGRTYRSLTAVAKEVTGAHWNGFLFFNL